MGEVAGPRGKTARSFLLLAFHGRHAFKAEGSRRSAGGGTPSFSPRIPSTPPWLSVKAQLLPIRTLHEQELRK